MTGRRKKRVLVCDDNPDIVEMIEMILEGEGYEVRSCSDGKQVFALITEATPDLVLLDIRMPDLDGLTILGRLRELGGELPPVLIFSAKCLTDDRENAIRAGACGFLQKPFTLEQLTSEIKRYIK